MKLDQIKLTVMCDRYREKPSEKLFKEICSQMENFCTKSIHPVPEGLEFEDCLQTCYLAIHEALQTYPKSSTTPIANYIMRKVEWCLKDSRRHQKCNREDTATQAEWDFLEEALYNPSVTSLINMIVLKNLLETLPLDEREIMRRRYEDHMTETEIGSSMGVSQQAISQRLQTILRKLRRQAEELDLL